MSASYRLDASLAALLHNEVKRGCQVCGAEQDRTRPGGCRGES